MVQFSGKYKLEKNENMDEFLTKMDVSFMKRKLALSLKPTVEVQVEGNQWKIITHRPGSTLTWSFTLDQESTVPSDEGTDITAIFTLEGGILRQKNLKGAERVDIVREFTDEGMIMYLTHKPSGVQCKRTFKRE